MTETRLYQVEDGWIELVSGKKFYFNPPDPRRIDPHDVAYALSRLCRFNGHTRRHYSVAEHTMIMADYVEREGGTAVECLTALHHDDAEYIIGDLPRPVKVKMLDFKAVEAVLDHAVAQRFCTLYPFPNWIRELDARILRDERAAVMNPSINEWGTDALEPLDVRFRPIVGRFVPLLMRAWLRRHYRWFSRAKWEGYARSEDGPFAPE